MRMWLLLVASLLLSCAGSPTGTAEAPDEWLALEPPRISSPKTDSYLAALAVVFASEDGTVGTGCLKALIIREDGPEELVFIDCLGERDGVPVRVVRLVAKQDVSQVLATAGFDAAAKVGTERFEAPIEASDSRLLGDVWLGMLRRARLMPAQSTLPRYYVSACEPLRGCRGGVATAKRPGAPAGKLTRLAELLSQLPRATEPDRGRLVGEIRLVARSLSKALE